MGMWGDKKGIGHLFFLVCFRTHFLAIFTHNDAYDDTCFSFFPFP